MMTRKKRNVLIFLGVLIPALVLAAMGGWYAQKHAFFRDADIIAGSEGDREIQDLSEQLGVRLDPALAQHAWLIGNRSRLVIHSGAVKRWKTEDENYGGEEYFVALPANAGAGSEGPIHVYTGTFEGENYTGSIVLIDSGAREYDGRPSAGMDVILQMRAGAGAFDDRRQRGLYANVMSNDAFWHTPEESACFYLYAPQENSWAVKPAERWLFTNPADFTLRLDPFPASLAGGGAINLIQLCGRMDFTDQGAQSVTYLKVRFGRIMMIHSDAWEEWTIRLDRGIDRSGQRGAASYTGGTEAPAGS